MDIKLLHRQAMEQTDLALMAQSAGRIDEAQTYFKNAYNLERQAALILKDQVEEEPARSVLFRSAASLALDYGDHSEAEKMICMALAGNPTHSIAEELRDLLEQVTFKRHLDLRGIKLQEDEVQMSIAGEGVGFGIAPTAAFLHRVSNTERLLLRTAERRLNKPYKQGGRYSKDVQEDVELYMSVPRAASFAVTFRIGSRDQIALPGMSKGGEVIREVLDCLELYNQQKTDELRKKIPDDAYYNNFVGLADSLAPDGDEVNLVGFTIQKGDGKLKEVAIRPRIQEIKHEIITKAKVVEIKDEIKDEVIKIIGVLLFADSKKKENSKIQVVDDGNNEHTLSVPEGMMDDIVKPLWNTRVIVTGYKKGRKIELDTIKPYRGK